MCVWLSTNKKYCQEREGRNKCFSFDHRANDFCCVSNLTVSSCFDACQSGLQWCPLRDGLKIEFLALKCINL